MPRRPVRKSVLAAKSLVGKKQRRKDPRVAQAIVRRSETTAAEIHLALVECQGEIVNHFDSWNAFLDGAPGWEDEVTIEQAISMYKTVAAATRALNQLDAARSELSVALDDLRKPTA